MDARTLTRTLPGGRWHGSYGSALCLAHDDKTPSLSIRDGDRGVLVKCHAGCEQYAVVAALRMRGLWPQPQSQPRTRLTPQRTERPTPPAPPVPKVGAATPLEELPESVQAALRIWHASVPIPGTPAEAYLRGRGLDPAKLLTDPPGWPETLRWHPDADGRGNGALIAAVSDAQTGLVRGVQRIFVHPDGSPVTYTNAAGKTVKDKRSRGAISGNAARLSCWPDPAGRWGLAEGVETALAARYITGISTWAALSAGNMPKVQPPHWARNVTIFADHDESETGLREAARALHRIRALPQVEKVRVASTEVLGTDVADLLGGIGDG